MDAMLLQTWRCGESMIARTSLHGWAKGMKPMKSRSVSEAAVFRFTWWDHYAGKEIVSPRSATREAITRCKGTPIEDSGILVNSRDVDANGFYSTPNG